ncbi:MAG: hypothetical protein ACLFR7_00980 [Opitutales bacterium]
MMIPPLLPVFFLTGLICGMGAFFFGAFVFEVSARQLGRLCVWLGGLLLVLPPAYFGVYMLAQPREPDDPPVTPEAAAIPATWLAIVLLGLLVGLWRAAAVRHQRAARTDNA